MFTAVVVLAVMLPMAMAAVFLLTRHLYRQQALREELSPVSRQHIELFQGGQLNEAAVESAKARFRDLLERGEVAAVEASLRAGVHYVVQVRALAELGTDDAGQILERQLHRRLTDDPFEQSWYWIDLAHGLRSLNRSQSLPHLLRCAESAGEIPLGQFFAAETICFLGFGGYLLQDGILGRSARRVLHRALEGLRWGVQPVVVAEARIGELIESLWDNRRDQIDPLAVRVYVEALRLLRRAPHAERMLAAEPSDAEAFEWQMSHLTSLEMALREYLEEVPALMRRAIPKASLTEQRDHLLALADLRAEAADVVLPLLDRPNYPHLETALEVLTHSSDSRVSPALRQYILDRLPLVKRAQKRRRATSPRRSSVPAEVPYRGVLRALRGHPSAETEGFLLVASQDWDPFYRAAAVGSLGWWEPVRRTESLYILQEARRDPSPDVRQAARAALARLGERQSLQWFRQSLTSEDPHRVHETIQAIATEGLTLLWPELDRLADSEDADVAHHARESLERMSEEMEGRRK
jgi:hypothetical protein